MPEAWEPEPGPDGDSSLDSKLHSMLDSFAKKFLGDPPAAPAPFTYRPPTEEEEAKFRARGILSDILPLAVAMIRARAANPDSGLFADDLAGLYSSLRRVALALASAEVGEGSIARWQRERVAANRGFCEAWRLAKGDPHGTLEMPPEREAFLDREYPVGGKPQ